MIIDAELAVMDYLAANIPTADVVRRRFYDDTAATAISVTAENGDGHEIPELVPVGIRITVRASRKSDAFALMQQVDALLDRQIRKQFNGNTECLGCARNTWPQPLDGGGGLNYYTCLYDMLLRSTA